MKTVTTANITTLIRGIIDDNLKTDGETSHKYDSSASFLLAHSYVSEATIKVYKNSTLLTLTTDYTYNSDTNRVTIIASLTKNDDILITYSYYEQYSDSEILSFIRASLPEFVKHRYSKYFYVNDSSEVVSMNDVNPTVEEGNIIALITAIKINPNNVNIRTKDFTISAEENKSPSEQIDDVFTQWTRSFGNIDFLEEEDELYD
jgi:hypothetical protein